MKDGMIALIFLLGVVLLLRISAAAARYVWGNTKRESGVATMVKFAFCTKILVLIIETLFIFPLEYAFSEKFNEKRGLPTYEDYYMPTPIEWDIYLIFSYLMLFFGWSLTVLRYNQNIEVLNLARKLLFGAIFYVVIFIFGLLFRFENWLVSVHDLDLFRLITGTHSWGTALLHLAVAFLPLFIIGTFVKKKA